MRSGQAALVPNTPAAAATTAMLPMASLREQIQTDRMLDLRKAGNPVGKNTSPVEPA